MIDNQGKYNPFTDKSLHSTYTEEQIKEDREGFNEAVDHFDIVNGFKSPKNISGLPNNLKKSIRIFAFICVSTFVIFILYQIINIIIAVTK